MVIGLIVQMEEHVGEGDAFVLGPHGRLSDQWGKGKGELLYEGFIWTFVM